MWEKSMKNHKKLTKLTEQRFLIKINEMLIKINFILLLSFKDNDRRDLTFTK